MGSGGLGEWHSPGPAWLFCPGTRPDRFAAAAEAADMVVLDLEDAVDDGDKAEARDHVVGALDGRGRPPLDPDRVVVRVNGLSTLLGEADLAALVDTSLRTVMVPKVDATADLDMVGWLHVVGLCETPGGVLSAPIVASHARTVALAWGGQDLAAALGTTPIDADTGSLHVAGAHARMAVRYAAAASGVAAIDTVWVALADQDGLAAEARSAARLGFAGKLVIHPNQVRVVRDAFRPPAAQVEWAHRVVVAFRGGVAVVDGQMVDAPVLARARGILDRAGPPATKEARR